MAPVFLEKLAAKLGLCQNKDGVPQEISPEDIFHYTYAVLNTIGYRSRYATFLRSDFPRLPLTSDLKLFDTLAKKGKQLVDVALMRCDNLNQS